MKKIILVFGFLCCLNVVMAQGYEFKPFRFDAGIGYGIPFEKNLDGGVSFYLEPKYAISNQIALGLRWEGAVFVGVHDNGESGDAKLNSNYLLTGDYYLNNNTFRPFVGAGLGFYSIAGASGLTADTDPGTLDLSAKTNFGAMLRAGFDVSHFRFTLSYNYGGKAGDETHQYLGISAGFYIGGGKKR